MTVISGFAEWINPDQEPDDLLTAAEKIKQTANGLTQLAESMRQIEETLTRNNCTRSLKRVADIANSVVEEYRGEFPRASIEITERTELWIHTDKELWHALDHAIENAIVHNDRAEPTVKIRIDESPNTGRVEIKVSDMGPTIPPNELTALDEYSETTDTTHGSGVGLFVMKWCVESLGGELKFEGSPPRGNDVYFYLPPADNNSS